MERLLTSPASVSDLAAPFEMALPSFTKHLGVLERAGLVRSVKTGRVRTYALNASAMDELGDWFSDRKALWETRLDALEDYLDQQQ